MESRGLVGAGILGKLRGSAQQVAADHPNDAVLPAISSEQAATLAGSKRVSAPARLQSALLHLAEGGYLSLKDAFSSHVGMAYSAGNSKRLYGHNMLLLGAAAEKRGYPSNAWCTYDEAKQNGWQVRKGEKGTQFYAWAPKYAPDKSGEVDPESGEPLMEVRPFLTTRTLFNVAQMDLAGGRPVPEMAGQLPVGQDASPEAIATLERIVDGMGLELVRDPAATTASYDESQLTIPTVEGDTPSQAASRLVVGLVKMSVAEGVQKQQVKDPELAEAVDHFLTLVTEQFVSMRLGFPLSDRTEMDAEQVFKVIMKDTNLARNACRDADYAARYMLAFDPQMLDVLRDEGTALYDEVLDAVGEDYVDHAFDATQLDFDYVEARADLRVKPS